MRVASEGDTLKLPGSPVRPLVPPCPRKRGSGTTVKVVGTVKIQWIGIMGSQALRQYCYTYCYECSSQTKCGWAKNTIPVECRNITFWPLIHVAKILALRLRYSRATLKRVHQEEPSFDGESLLGVRRNTWLCKQPRALCGHATEGLSLGATGSLRLNLTQHGKTYQVQT